MNNETKIIAVSSAGTAVALLALGAFFMDTGNKIAGFALLGSPILIGVGILLMKRSMVSMNKYSLPVQLKARELAEFIQQFNALESRLGSAARLLGASRETLPSLAPIRADLEPYLRQSEHADQPLEANARRQDEMDLALLNRQRTKLAAARANADVIIRQGTDALRSAAQPLIRDLEKMGWGKPLPPASQVASDPKDALEKLHGALHEIARSANDGLQGAIRSVEAEYKESASAVALREQALKAMESGNVLAALTYLRDGGRALEGRLKEGFDRGRNELLRALLELNESPGRPLLARATQDRIQELSMAIDSLHSPLQVGRIPTLRAQLVDLAGAALAELEAQVSKQEGGTEAWGLYVETFGGPAALPIAGGPVAPYLNDWRPRFEQLSSGFRDTLKDAKLRPLYKKLKPTIEATIKSKGLVTAKDLKLRDASEVFEQFARENPTWMLKNGSLVPAAADAPTGEAKQVKKTAPTKVKGKVRDG
ncbi:MAG: hypothetical protein V4510_05650 [bacterium]